MKGLSEFLNGSKEGWKLLWSKVIKPVWSKAIWPTITFLVWWVILLIPRGIWYVMEKLIFTTTIPLHDRLCGFFTLVSLAFLVLVMATGGDLFGYGLAGLMLFIFLGTWIWGRPQPK